MAQFFLDGGEADAVVVGAIDLAGGAENVLLRRLQSGIGPGTLAFTLGIEAGNWSIGEGCGALVLQRASDARKEGRRIHAVVESTAICSLGAAEGGLADSLERACAEALSVAKLEAHEIGCVEASASGIPAEDAAEARVLGQFFGARSAQKTALGGAKAIWGHCSGASGMAALLRAIFGLEAQAFLPVPGWKGPHASLAASRFFVPRQARPWLVPNGARRHTAITNLAHDGSAACAVLSDEPSNAPLPVIQNPAAQPLEIIALPADDRAALADRLETMASRLASESPAAISRETLRALAEQKPEHRSVLCIVGRSREELSREIKAALKFLSTANGGEDWRTPNGSCLTADPLGPDAPVAFVYPGIDPPYPGMMPDLFQLFPKSLSTLAAQYENPALACGEALLHPPSLTSLTPEDYEKIEAEFRRSPEVMLGASICYSSVVTKGLRDALGITPAHALGFSLGESTMLFSLGVWTPNDAWVQRLQSAEIFQTHLGGRHLCVREAFGLKPDEALRWGSHVLLTTAARVSAAIEGRSDVFISQISTQGEIVICGYEQACSEVVASLGCENFRTDLDMALHSPPAEPFSARLAEIVQSPVTEPGTRCHFTTGPAPAHWTPESVASLVSGGLAKRLDFPDLIGRAYEAGARIFVEIGPRNTCTRRIKDILKGMPHEAVAFDQKRGSTARDSVAKLVALLLSHRIPVNLEHWLTLLPAPSAPAHAARLRTVSLCGPSIAESLAERLSVLPSFASVPTSEPPESHEPFALPSPDVFGGSPFATKLAQLQQSVGRRMQAHRSMLRHQAAMGIQSNLYRSGIPSGMQSTQSADPGVSLASSLYPRLLSGSPPGCANAEMTLSRHAKKPALYDEGAVMEFAEGKASRVFGPEHLDIDALARRVRLPSPPFMAMSRVTGLQAVPFRFDPCWIETEYDIPSPAWHEVDGQVPYMAADAQGVLFLLGYIGIDRHNQGKRVYRWLDAEMRFAGRPLHAGKTVHYRIDIRSFVQHRDTLLFFTDFVCRVDGELFLEIKNCCAGFFSDEELSRGQGIVDAPGQAAKSRAISFPPKLVCERTEFSDTDLGYLQSGAIARCFGDRHAAMAARNPSLRLPPGPMRMIDRIRFAAAPGVAPAEVVAEKDLHPSDWYLRTHFKDSPVFAGPCMMEGCFQILQFYALYLGLAEGRDGLRFVPHEGAATKVRFRSQVPAEASVFTYEMRLLEVHSGPIPCLRANFDLIHHGVIVGRIEDLGLKLVDLESPKP